MPFTAFFAKVKRTPAAALRVVRGASGDPDGETNLNDEYVDGILVDEPIFLPMIEPSPQQPSPPPQPEHVTHSRRRVQLTNSLRAQRASSTSEQNGEEVEHMYDDIEEEEENNDDIPPFPLSSTPRNNSSNLVSSSQVRALSKQDEINVNSQNRNLSRTSTPISSNNPLFSSSAPSQPTATDVSKGKTMTSSPTSNKVQQYQIPEQQQLQESQQPQTQPQPQPKDHNNAIMGSGNSHVHKMVHNQQLYQRQKQKLPGEVAALRREIQKLLSERAEVLRIIAIIQGKNPPTDVLSSSSISVNNPSNKQQLPILLRETLQKLRDEKNDLKHKLFTITNQSNASVNINSSFRSSTIPNHISNINENSLSEPQSQLQQNIDHHHHHHLHHHHEPRSVKIIPIAASSSTTRKRLPSNSKRKSNNKTALSATKIMNDSGDDDEADPNKLSSIFELIDDDNSDEDVESKENKNKEFRTVKSEPSLVLNKEEKEKKKKKVSRKTQQIELNVLMKTIYDERKAASIERNKLLKELQSSRGETKKLREQAVLERQSMLEIKIKQRDSLSKAIERLHRLQKERDYVKKALDQSKMEKKSLIDRIKILNDDVKEAENILKLTRTEMTKLKTYSSDLPKNIPLWKQNARARDDDLTNRKLVRELRKRGEELTKKVENLRSQYGENSHQMSDSNNDKDETDNGDISDAYNDRHSRVNSSFHIGQNPYLNAGDRIRCQRRSVDEIRMKRSSHPKQPRKNIIHGQLNREVRGDDKDNEEYERESKQGQGNGNIELVRVVDLDTDIEIDDVDLDFVERRRSDRNIRRFNSTYKSENLELDGDIVFVYGSDDFEEGDNTNISSESTSVRGDSLNHPSSRRGQSQYYIDE